METKKINKIYPRCLKNENDKIKMKAYGHSAKGYILPCCWCDVADPEDDPEIQKLMTDELHLSKVDSIDEIVLSDQWTFFYNSITKNYENAPKCCQRQCGNTKILKDEKVFNSK